MIRYVRNSESELWRQCRLKWYLSYYRGFLSAGVVPNFWLGTFVHYVLSEWHLGNVTDPEHLFWWITEEWFAEHQSETIVLSGEELDFDEYEELYKYQAMGMAMVSGYVEWANRPENQDFDVIDSELAYFVPMKDNDGRPFTIVARFDLLIENSEGIRVRDFKTAKDFRDKKSVHTYNQFRRYPWLIKVAHPEWEDEIAGAEWVGLRKIIPSGRSKPPYYDRQPIDLTPEELDQTGREMVAEVTEMLRTEQWLDDDGPVRSVIYPNPTFDCTWKCEYFKNGLCRTWRAGQDVTEAGKIHGTWGNDPYAEYKEDDTKSVLVTIGRRET